MHEAREQLLMDSVQALKAQLDSIESRLVRIERTLASSLLAPTTGTPHQRKKEPESYHLDWGVDPSEPSVGGLSPRALRALPPQAAEAAGVSGDCSGVAVAGALGLGDGLLAPLGAPGGAGNGRQDHTQNDVSREIVTSPLKKNRDVKMTHPLQDLWNEHAPSVLPRWLATNPTRKRRADELMRVHRSTDLILAIRRIANSDFLMGRNFGPGGRNWRANPEWFLRPGNVTRLLEGEFDTNDSSTSKAVSGFGPSHPLHPDNIAKRAMYGGNHDS